MFIYVTATPHPRSHHGARKTRIDFVVGSARIINDGPSRKETAHCELPEPAQESPKYKFKIAIVQP